MENKLIHMILFYLEDGEKKRHEVTNKIKNYPKELRADAISYVVKEKLVRIFEKQAGSGRVPAYIELTEKGQERVSELSRTPKHTSVWSV